MWFGGEGKEGEPRCKKKPSLLAEEKKCNRGGKEYAELPEVERVKGGKKNHHR
jgi:hypothetical protein